MFRRKEEGVDNPESVNDLLSSVEDETIDTSAPSSTKTEEANPATPSAAPASPTHLTPAKPMTATAFRPQSAPNLAANRPPAAPADTRSTATNQAPATTTNTATKNASKRVLTVGHDIHMKGEISTCDRLVIEGSVDATLKDVHTVEIAQTGSFKGTAEIEDAEISGTFDGDLVVRGRLIIYSTGKVTGSVAYGEIEIERGGQLAGTIQTASQLSQAKDKKKAA